jgi:hypothetical protein
MRQRKNQQDIHGRDESNLEISIGFRLGKTLTIPMITTLFVSLSLSSCQPDTTLRGKVEFSIGPPAREVLSDREASSVTRRPAERRRNLEAGRGACGAKAYHLGPRRTGGSKKR